MEQYKKIKIASILGIVGNIFLVIIKSIIGFITSSQAMIADAFNSAGDIFTSIMTYIGNKVSSKPHDDDHNLGHGKAEYIYSMLISIFVILSTLIIIKDSIIAILKNHQYNFSYWLIIVCLITIIVKFLLYLYTNKIAKKYHNLLIKANSKDHLNDCFLTSSNLIACICALFNIYIVDSIVGIIISIWIIVSYAKIFKESYDVLMDKSIKVETKNKVLNIINSHKEIKKINHFNSTPVGLKFQISLTIFVDGDLKTYESHEIADKLEKEIVNNIDEIYLAVIHVNPIKKED